MMGVPITASIIKARVFFLKTPCDKSKPFFNSTFFFSTASREFYLAITTGLTSFSTCIFWEASKTSTGSASCMSFNVISASTDATLEPNDLGFYLILSQMFNTSTVTSPSALWDIFSTRQQGTLCATLAYVWIAPDFRAVAEITHS